MTALLVQPDAPTCHDASRSNTRSPNTSRHGPFVWVDSARVLPDNRGDLVTDGEQGGE
jgi:hypothetical protein